MTVESGSMRECVYAGAVQGVVGWTAYGVIECTYSSIVPWLVLPTGNHTPLNWNFTALLFVLYATFGLVLGGLSGLGLYMAARRIPSLQRVQSSALFSTVATLGVVLAFSANLFSHAPLDSGFTIWGFRAIVLLLAVGLVVGTRSITWLGRVRFLANPWTVSLILVGLSWIAMDVLKNDSRAIKSGAALVYLGGVLFISFVICKEVKERQTRSDAALIRPSPTKALSALVALVLVVLGISYVLNQPSGILSTKVEGSSLRGDRPNVIVITMDTVRADHLSAYGYTRNTTPYLKSFSEEATLYTHAIASGDVTLSTHASIFTGMYARAHGAHWDPPEYPHGRPLAEKYRTLAEILSQNGYLTAAVVANFGHLGPAFGLNQGFHYYDHRRAIPFLQSCKEFYLRNALQKFMRRFGSPFAFESWYRRAEHINTVVFHLLAKVEEYHKPFFLFINYMDAHTPYVPPSPYDVLFSGKDGTFTEARYRFMMKEVMQLKRKMTEEEHRHIASQYDGEIAYLDFHLGKLFQKLKDLGLYENSLIVITSDHGEAFGERNLVQHGTSVYQDQVHIPLIVKFPKANERRVVRQLTSVVDLMPTILDIVGYEIPKNVQGESLLKLKQSPPRIVISESFRSDWAMRWHERFDRVERALFYGELKFVASTAGKRELYDLSRDPNEMENIYGSGDGIARGFEGRLDKWLEMVVPEFSSPEELDKETVDHLRALGYIR